MAKKDTEIKVVALYDGGLDAEEVFAGLIAQRYGKNSKDSKDSRVIPGEVLAERKEVRYNGGKVQQSRMPSGLCG